MAIWHFFCLLGIAGVIFLLLSEACSDLFEMWVCDGICSPAKHLAAVWGFSPWSDEVQAQKCRQEIRSPAQLCWPQQGSARLPQAVAGPGFGHQGHGAESLSRWRRGSAAMAAPGNSKVNSGIWTQRSNSASQLLDQHDLLLMGSRSVCMDGHRVCLMAIIVRGGCQEGEEV